VANEKRKAILDAAELLFATKGFGPTTMSDIAKESGVAHEASIYSQFKNKRDILFGIYGSHLQKASKSLNAHFQGMKEPGPKFRKAIWHYLEDMKENPNYAKVLMMAQRENPDFYASEHVQHLETYISLVLGAIIAGQEDGTFRKDISPRLIRNMAMGASVHFAFYCTARDQYYDPNEISDQIYVLVSNAARVETPFLKTNKKGFRGGRVEFRKSQILNTATRIFANKGFSNATISEIAKQANLGDGTLYEYFENKKAILLGIAENHLQDLCLDKCDAAPFAKEEKDLRRLLWRWLWLIYSDEDFARILCLELFRNIDFYSSPVYECLLGFLARVSETVQLGQTAGVFVEKVPLSIYSHMITGTFDQYLISQFLLNRPAPVISKLSAMVDALVRAIRVREV
jgi:TetR/AcrR family fatty acid metabolism transcriptional regulator